jgi:hypothetical protein
MKQVIWVLWPAFIAAGIAETAFFTLIDPRQLYLLGQPVDVSATATYSIGFLLFWLLCVGSSLMTYLMLPQSIKDALGRIANEREDLSRPKRRVHATGGQ